MFARKRPVNKKPKPVEKSKKESEVGSGDQPKKKWIEAERVYDLEPLNRYAKIDMLGNDVTATENFSRCLKLDETYESVDLKVPGFNITLLPHQGVTVRAMLDLEKIRHIRAKIAEHEMPSCFANDVAIVETCAGVLSDKLGSGKTYDILALIKLASTEGMPKVANITDIDLPHQQKVLRTNQWKSHIGYQHIGWKTEIRRIYKKLIPISLIFVSKSVILQWVQSIKENTDLKVFMIENIFSLKMFYEMIFAPTKKNNLNTLKQYQIVLVKNGNISGKFEVPELDETGLDEVRTKPILSVFGELFKHYCFERVVLDDFDTLGVPATAITIPSMFTWFVSATKKLFNGNIRSYPAKDIVDSMSFTRPAYANAWKNRTLFTFFNISNTDEFTDRSTKASKVEFFVYKFTNPNESYIGLLGVMGTADAQTIMEALNGDAIQTAAGEVGLKSTSVADIFEKVLDNKWTLYKKNLEIHSYVGAVESWYGELPDPDDDEDPVSSTTLTKVSRNLKKPGPMLQLKSMISYTDTGVAGTISEVKTENTVAKEFNGKAIDRVRDNLKQGDCPILGTPLKDGGIVILKCCGITISREAASWSLKLQKTSSTNAGEMAGSCPNCRRPILFSQLIVVDQDLNLDDIVNERIAPIDDQVPIETDEETENETEKEVEELNKYSCIVRIIRGTDDSEDIRKIKTTRDVKIPSMLVGQYDKGTAPVSDRKVLVYASFNETLDHLTKKLVQAGIAYLRLQGTAHQIQDMVRRYNMPNDNPESIAVLLINGPTYCAGLNLQITSDLIFTHKIIDQNVESQVAGRASRFGRNNNLHIHYVLYDNEIVHMFGASAI